MTLRFIFIALLYVLIQPVHLARADDEARSVEDLVRCSDLVVLARVTETIHEGIVAGPGSMVYTRHILRVENYYVGSGPEEITVLTPGGFERQPDGRETFTQVVTSGGIGVRPGESLLAFLQVFPPAYRFLNRDGAKAMVATDDSTGDRAVSLHFDKVELLGDTARERYEKLKGELARLSGEELRIATRRLKYALTEVVPVSQLRSRLGSVLKVVGGPKPPTTTCY